MLSASTVPLAMVAENITLSPSGSFHGVVATLADSGPAEPASAYEATINWGKGRRSAGMVTGSNGRFVVSGRQVFPRFTGPTTVTVTVTNEANGQSASVSELVSVAPRKSRAIRVVPQDRRRGQTASLRNNGLRCSQASATVMLAALARRGKCFHPDVGELSPAMMVRENPGLTFTAATSVLDVDGAPDRWNATSRTCYSH